MNCVPAGQVLENVSDLRREIERLEGENRVLQVEVARWRSFAAEVSKCAWQMEEKARFALDTQVDE